MFIVVVVVIRTLLLSSALAIFDKLESLAVSCPVDVILGLDFGDRCLMLQAALRILSVFEASGSFTFRFEDFVTLVISRSSHNASVFRCLGLRIAVLQPLLNSHAILAYVIGYRTDQSHFRFFWPQDFLVDSDLRCSESTSSFSNEMIRAA